VAYISLYRKYRAQDFEELLGQSHVTVTLRNAIQQGRLAHAYLFCGPRGTGKTSTARLLAKSLNCEQGPTPNPCKVCRFCRAIQEGNCVDVVEMDAASETSIDDVRTSIIENAKYPPMEARYKIYIIDEVHDLSAKAFDALLKTIEEPPPHVVFILATTEFHRVPPTIRSRCQRFDFHRGTIADITRRLEQVLAAEGFTAEPAALHLVARAADGSWRDALTALEQVIAFSEGGAITAQTVYNALGLLEDETLMQLTDALLERDAGRALQLLEGQMLLGREPRVFAESLIQHWRALIQAALHAHDRAGAYDPTVWSAMIEQARRAGIPRLLAWWEQTAGALSEMRTSGFASCDFGAVPAAVGVRADECAADRCARAAVCRLRAACRADAAPCPACVDAPRHTARCDARADAARAPTRSSNRLGDLAARRPRDGEPALATARRRTRAAQPCGRDAPARLAAGAGRRPCAVGDADAVRLRVFQAAGAPRGEPDGRGAQDAGCAERARAAGIL
jgi:DNA polymerase-3 subunit gamma/tau